MASRIPDGTVASTGPSSHHSLRLGKWTKRILLASLMLTVGMGWIYPFIWTFSSSLKPTTEIFGSLNPFTSVVNIGNWTRAVREASMGRYFLNTLIVTAGSILISVTVSALMGYAVGRYRFPGRRAVFAMFGLVIFLPEGYTIIPIYDLLTRLGLDQGLFGLILAEAGGVNVIAVLLYAGYFAQLPKELEDAARMDGAGFLRTFAQVYLPLARPVTATAIILQFLHSWNDFLLPLVFTLTKPELRTLSVGVYALRNDYQSDWGVMTAAATMALLPVIVIFLLLQRHFVASVAGAVKG